MSRLTERPIAHRKGCASDMTGLGVVLCANGARQVRTFCLECAHASGSYSAKELAAAGIRVELLPVVKDYRSDIQPAEPCVVCHSAEQVENHHFAPQALQAHFRLSVWDWPVVPLCRICHEEWHAAVTPELVLTQTRLEQLGAKRSMTLRELMDSARERIGQRLRKSA